MLANALEVQHQTLEQKLFKNIAAATTDDPITLYVKYVATGDDVATEVFTNGERISANGTVGSFGADVESAQLELADATATGSSANIEEGVYFIRGHFVREQTKNYFRQIY